MAMRTVFTELSQGFGNYFGTPSKLSRLHVHTLAYQAMIAVRRQSLVFHKKSQIHTQIFSNYQKFCYCLV